jgi:GAF domain/ANTAR domain
MRPEPAPLDGHASSGREEALGRAFVELADTLGGAFELPRFLDLFAERCVQLLDVGAAGLALADRGGRLRALASSWEPVRDLLEVAGEGPCWSCFRTGRPVADRRLANRDPRWPTFGRLAAAAGFRSVHALPLRHGRDTIGVLGLFSTVAGPLLETKAKTGQALADVAAIGLLQRRAVGHGHAVAERLEAVLCSQVVIEQAKGILAERFGIGMPGSFELVRDHARRRQLPVAEVARQIVAGVAETASIGATGTGSPIPTEGERHADRQE